MTLKQILSFCLTSALCLPTTFARTPMKSRKISEATPTKQALPEPVQQSRHGGNGVGAAKASKVSDASAKLHLRRSTGAGVPASLAKTRGALGRGAATTSVTNNPRAAAATVASENPYNLPIGTAIPGAPTNGQTNFLPGGGRVASVSGAAPQACPPNDPVCGSMAMAMAQQQQQQSGQGMAPMIMSMLPALLQMLGGDSNKKDSSSGSPSGGGFDSTDDSGGDYVNNTDTNTSTGSGIKTADATSGTPKGVATAPDAPPAPGTPPAGKTDGGLIDPNTGKPVPKGITTFNGLSSPKADDAPPAPALAGKCGSGSDPASSRNKSGWQSVVADDSAVDFKDGAQVTDPQDRSKTTTLYAVDIKDSNKSAAIYAPAEGIIESVVKESNGLFSMGHMCRVTINHTSCPEGGGECQTVIRFAASAPTANPRVPPNLQDKGNSCDADLVGEEIDPCKPLAVIGSQRKAKGVMASVKRKDGDTLGKEYLASRQPVTPAAAPSGFPSFNEATPAFGFGTK